MMSKMAASNDFFMSTCTDVLERMINTVPKGVELTDVIHPYPVKPSFLRTELGSNGTMTVSGHIRVSSILL
jgi:hypothetical protein